MKKYNLRLKYGTFNKDGDDWRDGLPDDISGDKGLADFNDIGGLAKAYLDTKADNGRSLRIPGAEATPEAKAAFNASLIEKIPGLTRIPGDDSSDEDKASFYTQMGKPAEATGYTQPENLSDALKDGMNALAKVAFENDLTQAQFKRLATNLVTDSTAAGDAVNDGYTDQNNKLKLDWGSALGAKSQAILELAKQTGAPESIVNAITNKQLDMNTMKWMDGLVESLSGEGGQMNFQGNNDEAGRVTPTEAATQIDEIMNRKEYFDSGSPLQAGLIKKVVELGKIATAS